MSVRLVAAVAAVLLAGAVVAVMTVSRDADEQEPGAAASARPAEPAAVAASARRLPAPAGETVLRVSGVARGNAGAHVTKADFATLDRLARERVTVREPFLKRDVTFTGVRFGALLAAAGGTADARTVFLDALDDYHVELPLAAIADDALLATRANGKPIPIAKGGPIRLVFAARTDTAANTDNWIWSIDAMRLER